MLPLSRRFITRLPIVANTCLTLLSCWSLRTFAHQSGSVEFGMSSSQPTPHLLRSGNSATVLDVDTIHTHTLIWLHGLGDSYAGFQDMFEGIKLPNTKVVLPNAPILPVTVNGGMKMRAWYDILTLGRDLGMPKQEDEKNIRQSAAHLRELINHEAKIVGGSDKIIVGGFSQGAAMSLFTGLSHPEKLGGIMVCSGYMLMAKEYPAHIHNANKDTPVFGYHGASDEVVPLQFAELGNVILRNNHVQLSFESEPYLGHSMSQREMQKMVQFIQQQQQASSVVN